MQNRILTINLVFKEAKVLITIKLVR